MDCISGKLVELKSSNFRRKFHLSPSDKEVVRLKGIEVMKQHAYEIVSKRLKIPTPRSDMTPYNGYPVFTAQHATATCCRKCIEKWHRIPAMKVLDNYEIEKISSIITGWIETELEMELVLA